MASSLATLAEVRTHVESDLSDEALERLVDSADADIVKSAGAHDGERTVDINGGYQDLLLPAPANTIASVSESEYFGDAETVASSEYTTLYGGRVLRKDGIWKSKVSVTYTPVSTNAKRKEVLMQLVALAADYTPALFHADGAYSQTSRDYAKEKRRLLTGVQYSYTMMA